MALKSLYGNETPVRGQIRVTFKGGIDYKVNGPISQVVTLITGAAGESGFKGLGGGRYNRHNLLSFDETQEASEDAVCTVIFERMDTKKKIEISYCNYMLPANPKMGELMPLAVTGKGTDAEIKEFGELWHERIKGSAFKSTRRNVCNKGIKIKGFKDNEGALIVKISQLREK